MYSPVGNTPDPIWRVLASSDGISSWTPLKRQHSNPNLNPLANHLWCIDFLTPHEPLIIPHRLSAILESLMPLKNWCSIHARWSKSSLSNPTFLWHFSKFKTESYCIYSKVSDCIFEIHQLWSSGFIRVYFNCCRSCSFEPETIEIGKSSHKTYSNYIVNFQESDDNFKCLYKKVWKLMEFTTYISLYISLYLSTDLRFSNYVVSFNTNSFNTIKSV